jgi:hypothetical protein
MKTTTLLITALVTFVVDEEGLFLKFGCVDARLSLIE